MLNRNDNKSIRALIFIIKSVTKFDSLIDSLSDINKSNFVFEFKIIDLES